MSIYVRIWWRGETVKLVHVQDVPIMHVVAPDYAATVVTDTEFDGVPEHAEAVRAAITGGSASPAIAGRSRIRHGVAGDVWGGGPVSVPVWEVEA